jgi:hypothetical protein
MKEFYQFFYRHRKVYSYGSTPEKNSANTSLRKKKRNYVQSVTLIIRLCQQFRFIKKDRTKRRNETNNRNGRIYAEREIKNEIVTEMIR